MSNVKIKRLRTVASMQIGPHGSTLDEDRTGCTMELRPELHCVLARGNFNGTVYREILIPLNLCVHMELEPSVIVPDLERPPAQTATGKLVAPAEPPPPTTTAAPAPNPQPQAKEPFRSPKKY